MYFCCSWFSNMVSFRCVLVVLNFLHDIFSIKFYTISFLWDLYYSFLLMRNITRWMLDTEVKVFHESISYFMKWPWNCISWNALKEKFHSVFFPLPSSKTSVLILSLYIPIFFECSVSLWVYLRNQERVSFIWWYWHWYYTFIDLSYCYTDDNSNPLCFKVTKSKTKYSSCIIIR